MIPSLDKLLQESFPMFAYDKAFEAGRWDPLFIMYVLRNRKDQYLARGTGSSHGRLSQTHLRVNWHT